MCRNSVPSSDFSSFLLTLILSWRGLCGLVHKVAYYRLTFMKHVTIINFVLVITMWCNKMSGKSESKDH